MIGAAIGLAYYSGHEGHAHLAAGDDDLLPLPAFIDISALTEKGLKNIFEGTAGLVEPNLFQLTNDAIGHAVTVGVLQYGKPNPAFMAHMQQTGTWFSARKTYQQQQELARLLKDDTGKTKRTWREFRKAAQPIVGTYNERWLKTEYNTAIRAARMGSRWKDFEANDDLYPNVEYMPSRAATPRDDHKPYYHVIRPLNDEFWTKHYPPSDYNCMCGAEPTDADPTPLPEVQPGMDLPQPAPGLDHNPGQTEQVFSDSHPYTAALKTEGADIEAIDQEGERLARKAGREQTKLIAAEQLIKRGKEVERKELARPIQFNMKGVKEAINQPHKHYMAKLALIQNGLEEALRQAKYIASRPNDKIDTRPTVLAYHYFEFMLAGETSFFVIEEDIQGKYFLYSITDRFKGK